MKPPATGGEYTTIKCAERCDWHASPTPGEGPFFGELAPSPFTKWNQITLLARVCTVPCPGRTAHVTVYNVFGLNIMCVGGA